MWFACILQPTCCCEHGGGASKRVAVCYASTLPPPLLLSPLPHAPLLSQTTCPSQPLLPSPRISLALPSPHPLFAHFFHFQCELTAPASQSTSLPPFPLPLSSGKMLGRDRVSLNALAFDSTCALIEGVLGQGVNLAEAYIDALGDTSKHRVRRGKREVGKGWGLRDVGWLARAWWLSGVCLHVSAG